MVIITEDDIYFWLAQAQVSPRRLNKILLNASIYDIWNDILNFSEYKILFGEKNYAELRRYRNEDYLSSKRDELYTMGIGFIARSDQHFPMCLTQEEVDPPAGLFYKGNADLLNSDCFAIVGTRACSRYGKDMAERFASDLSKCGLTIVSGLATGIDAYAHSAALESGGKTIAVLGSGLNKMTPVGNIGLFKRIIDSGSLVVSQYLPNADAAVYTFPERNRIISGLSLGTLVIEAGFKSGSLITADFCLEQNRALCVVPSNLGSVKSAGSNNLLRKREAYLVTCAEDVCEQISHTFKKFGEKNVAIQLDIFEQKIYNLLSIGDASFDDMVVKLQMSPSELSTNLSSMEINGLIRKKQSNIYSL